MALLRFGTPSALFASLTGPRSRTLLGLTMLAACSGGGLPSDGTRADLAVPPDFARAAPTVGDACRSSSECPRNCLLDPAWPNGYCTTVQLDCRVANDCPSGTLCGLVNPPGNEICLRRCRVDNDCRTSEGYACCLHGAGGLVCLPLRFCR